MTVELTPRSYEAPCTWTAGNGEQLPATLTITLDKGGWWICVTPDGWVTLWLSKSEAPPWGPWRTTSATKHDHAFETAQAAVDAAFATEQISEMS